MVDKQTRQFSDNDQLHLTGRFDTTKQATTKQGRILEAVEVAEAKKKKANHLHVCS